MPKGRAHEARFTRADGSTGAVRSVYFETDRRDTRDPDAGYAPAPEAALLPRSGNLQNLARRLSEDAGFRADWTALADAAAGLDAPALRSRLEGLLLRWAGLDGVDPRGRGEFADARHLGFVEAFFGEAYRSTNVVDGGDVRSYPVTAAAGAAVEGAFAGLVAALSTVFVTQATASAVARGGDLAAAFASPYLFFALLDLGGERPEGAPAPGTPGNVRQVLELTLSLAPTAPGAAAEHLAAVMAGLDGMVGIAFAGDRGAYAAALAPVIATITDPMLRDLAADAAAGRLLVGGSGEDVIAAAGAEGHSLQGGAGDDALVGGAGGDLYLHARGDGHDLVVDRGGAAGAQDILFLTDAVLADLSFVRRGDDLTVSVAGSPGSIRVADHFRAGSDGSGIEGIRLADGTTLTRAQIETRTLVQGTALGEQIRDTQGDDAIRGGRGHDAIIIEGGNDRVVWARGDGHDRTTASARFASRTAPCGPAPTSRAAPSSWARAATTASRARAATTPSPAASATTPCAAGPAATPMPSPAATGTTRSTTIPDRRPTWTCCGSSG